MKKKYSISLIIQGPLISEGVSGGTYRNGENIVSYDCIDNINKLISNYGNMFHEIIISTWDDGVHDSYSPKGARIVRIQNPYKNINKKGIYSNIKKHDVLKSNSSKMAILGASSAINMLEDVDYILRVRTDMYMDLSIVYDFITNNIITDKVYVPYIQIGSGLPDFYFFGKFGTLKEFYNILMKDDISLHTNIPHTNMILKYAKYKYNQDICAEDWAYYCKESSSSYNIIMYMMINAFIALPRDLYMSARWRGALWNDNYVSNFKGCFSPLSCTINYHESKINFIEKLFFYPPKTILGKIIRRVSLVYIVGLVKFLNKTIH